MSRRRVVVIVAVSVLLALPVLEQLVGMLRSGQAGEVPNSTYSTGPDGASAWAELAARQGRRVRRAHRPFAREPVDARDTLVADDVSLSRADEARVRAHLLGGGRLVAVGPRTGGMVGRLAGVAAPWTPAGAPRAARLTETAEVAAVREVRTDGIGAWELRASAEPLLGTSGRVVAAAFSVGGGRVVAVADPSVFHNRRLPQAANAAFALAVLGEDGRAVVFGEAGHGFGTSASLGTLPLRWRVGVVIALVATASYLWSRGKRFGEPDRDDTPVAPPRVTFVHSLAATLARTSDHGVTIDR